MYLLFLQDIFCKIQIGDYLQNALHNIILLWVQLDQEADFTSSPTPKSAYFLSYALMY